MSICSIGAATAVPVKPQDVSSLPFADETFDLVTCAHLLEHLHEPPTGLQEMVKNLL
jgi:ubiquinone/menaquinone biosynthesis C-methylase UbiE